MALTLIAIEALLKLAQKAGVSLDPNELGKEKLKAKFAKVSPNVVARLEKDGHTPKEDSDSDEEKRQLIRSAEYLLWKETFQSILGKPEGSNLIADRIRDRHDDKVVPVVLPQVNATLSTADLVKAVAEAELELTT